MPNLIEKAEAYCELHGFRLTEPRRQVLQILVEAQKPLGAYDVLQRLTQHVKAPKPPTVYRAIQFWCEEGFVHCIDSLKAYVACPHGHHIGEAQFFICKECGDVSEETGAINRAALQASAKKNNFIIKSCTTEVKGICGHCTLHLRG